MKIYGKCKNCGSEIGCSTSSDTRVEFAMREGETKTLRCKNCNAKNEFHVDELSAKESKIAQIAAVIIFVIGTPLSFFLINPIFTGSRNHYVIYFVGGFLLIPVMAYGIIRKQDRRRVNAFNHSKLKGRMHNIGR